MSNVKFTKNKTSFSKETRLICGVPRKVWESFGKLAEATTKLLDVGIKTLDWALDAPAKTKRFLTDTYYKIKYGLKNWKGKLKAPGTPKNLPEYKDLDAYFKDPQASQIPGANFDTNIQPNHALYAAAYHRRLCYLQYLLEGQEKFHEDALKEYKRLVKGLKKFKKRQIVRGKKKKRLQIKLQLVEANIRGSIHTEDDISLTGGAHEHELDADVIDWKAKRQKILSELQILSQNIYPVETRGKYSKIKVLYPAGSSNVKHQFYIDDSTKVTKNINDSIKELEGMVNFKGSLKKMDLYSSEIEKLAYWRDYSVAMKTVTPAEKNKFDLYKQLANSKLNALRTTLVVSPIP